MQGEMRSPAPRKALLSQCCSGPDPALPTRARQSPRHHHRARHVKSSCDPLGVSLSGCKSWLILLLLLAVEGFSGVSDEKKIYLPDLTHLSALLPQG